MNRRVFTRRRFITSLATGIPCAAVSDALWIEPEWLKVRKVRLSTTPSHRVVHFTDLHHKGDRAYLESVVEEINHLGPDFVCFTGDLVEEEPHVAEALEILKKIKAPLYGIPGNHDYWCNADFDQISEAFAATGGAWLADRHVKTRDGKVTINGAGTMAPANIQTDSNTKNIMLVHYPEWADRLKPHRFDLILAGHTHGGQVRLPFYGALMLPWGTGEYDLGLFSTGAGPLYVSSGIGWFFLNLRFLCRPEIVLFEF